MRKSLFITVMLAYAIAALALEYSRTRPAVNAPVISGAESVVAPVAYPPYPDPPQTDGIDLVGDTVMIGDTWYENQHNGTIGRMIERNADRWVDISWMDGLDSMAASRHIFYNAIDPSGNQLLPYTGQQVDASMRAGFTTLDVLDGKAFPAFHLSDLSPPVFHTGVATDFFPHAGVFVVSNINNPPGLDEVIWPKMQIDHQNRVLVVSTENTGIAGAPQRQYYTWGTYDGVFSIDFAPWTLMAWTMTIAPDVATSEVSNRIAFAWTYPLDPNFPDPGYDYNQYDNDIKLLIDEDGLNPDFNQAINLTNFILPDSSWLPDTLLADMDTLRAYTDLNVFFDQDDWAHVAFTTRAYYALEGFISTNQSIIWHWSEQYPNEYQMVHYAFDDTGSAASNYCGAWNVKAQRPELGQNLETGELFCMYQVYDTDTTHMSGGLTSGWPSGEIYVSRSSDGGLSWAVGTNVTNTITPYTPPVVPGISRSELTPSLAKRVDDYMHIVYVMDTDAGNILQTEGSWTLSPVKYHRVPIDAIPTTPLVPQTVPFHVEHGTPGGPDVTINLTALGSTQIPPWGGSFSYIITVTNTTTLAQPVDIWTMTQLPTGNWYGPILGPVAVTVPPNMNYSRTRSQFVPGTAPAGTYLYEGRVGVYPDSILDSDGFTFTKTGADQSGQGISEWLCTGEDFPAQPAEARPASFALSASPNPFNPSTMFRYELRAASYVSLMIYDTAGRLVAEPVDGWRQTGYHQATFDGSDLPSGIYFARLTVMSGSGTTPATSTQKLVLLK